MSEERRIVTVLFADVSGSTELGETLDPEDVRALLARYYAIAREVVAHYGGTLEKFIGDAVMAVFGLPQAHDDDARRALEAAIELRDRVRADPKLTDRLAIRLGVNTGEVVATRDGSATDFLVTGDAINIAARLQQTAEPWSIVCGERTARAVPTGFDFAPAAEIGVKGKALPVRGYEVRGRLSRQQERAQAPLFGRDGDLAQLNLVAGRVFRERRPFLVSVVAPAGTGKSRLLEEFLAGLPGLAPDARVAVAQCLPYGQRLTYWPLRSVLLSLLGLAEDAAPQAFREALHAWVEATGREDARPLADLLAATVGVGETEVADRSALFAAWRSAVEVAAGRAPLVLVFEDLHWSSDSLLDLVEFVMQPRGDVPVLMLALARPELLDRRPGWGGGRRNYLSLALEPLDDDDVAALVEHVLNGTAPEVVRRVVARAEGNPFYAGELVRTLLDRAGSLADAAGVERALATLPDTVQGTVLARLDLLPTDERRAVQLGAVFGRAFTPAGLAALEPGLATRSEALVEALAERDLVRPAGADHGGYAFRHILIREVAYQTLPRAERAALHAAAGRWLEGTSAGQEDARAELIAYHFREAATLAANLGLTDDDGWQEVSRRAVVWLRRAADAAMAGAAQLEAARHLRAAIELAEPRSLPDLYERLGDVLTGGDAAVQAYRTALQLGEQAGWPDERRLHVLAGVLTVYLCWQGSVGNRPSEEQVAALVARGRELVARCADQRAAARFFIAEGFYPFWRRAGGERVTEPELARAETSARRGLELAEQMDEPRLRSRALDGLASVAQERNRWDEVRSSARQRLAFADRLDLAERIDAHAMIAWASVVLGDLGEAQHATAAGLRTIQPGQAPAWTLHLVAWRVLTACLSGAWDEALAQGDRARQLWIEIGRSAAGYSMRGFLAAHDVARARQDRERMDAYREVIQTIGPASHPRTPPHHALLFLGGDLDALTAHVLSAFPVIDLGTEYVERALSLCCDRQHPPSPDVAGRIAAHAAAQGKILLEAQAHRALGLGMDEPRQLEEALALFEGAGAVPYAARARYEVGLLTGDEAAVGTGRRVLEALGDVEQLARFESARASRPTLGV